MGIVSDSYNPSLNESDQGLDDDWSDAENSDSDSNHNNDDHGIGNDPPNNIDPKQHDNDDGPEPLQMEQLVEPPIGQNNDDASGDQMEPTDGNANCPQPHYDDVSISSNGSTSSKSGQSTGVGQDHDKDNPSITDDDVVGAPIQFGENTGVEAGSNEDNPTITAEDEFQMAEEHRHSQGLIHGPTDRP